MQRDFNLAFFGSSNFVQPICEKVFLSQGRPVAEIVLEQLDYVQHIPDSELVIPELLSSPEKIAKLKELVQTSETLKGKLKLKLVVTQPDRINRNKTVQNPVSDYAKQVGLSLFTPLKLKESQTDFFQAAEGLDMALVASYGQIIPAPVLNFPSYGMINWHPSLLPQYRGPTPMQTALHEAIGVTGLSWINVAEKMDAGEIILQMKKNLGDKEDFFGLADLMAQWGIISWGLVVGLKVLDKTHPEDMAELGLTPQQQDERQVTFCKMLNKDDRFVPDNASAAEIFNHWRAYQAFPGTTVNDEYFGGPVKLLICNGTKPGPELQGQIGDAQAAGKWLKVKISGEWLTFLRAADGNYVTVEEIGLADGKRIKLKGYNFVGGSKSA